MVNIHHNTVLTHLKRLTQGGHLHAGNGNAVPSLQVECEQFLICVITYIPTSCGRAVYRLVMAKHQHTVFRHLHVQLHHIDTHANNRFNGGEGILWVVAPVTTMSYNHDIIRMRVVQLPYHTLSPVQCATCILTVSRQQQHGQHCQQKQSPYRVI